MPESATDLLALLGAVCIVAASVCGGAWLLQDLPGVLLELRRLVSSWASFHEVSRVVDCTPWGLEKKFTIDQDYATTVPAQATTCWWASVPGRKWEFGLCLWNGAVALSRLLTEQRKALSSGAFAEGRTVLELGCGQPLVSMVVFELFPQLRRIVATDGCEDILPIAETNIVANLGLHPANLEVAVLRWGYKEDIRRARAMNQGEAYDVILGADITYDEEHDDLVDTIVALSHANTEVWITHEPRRRSTDELVGRLRKEFRNFEESVVLIPPHGKGRDGEIEILAWHCSGKIAV